MISVSKWWHIDTASLICFPWDSELRFITFILSLFPFASSLENVLDWKRWQKLNIFLFTSKKIKTKKYQSQYTWKNFALTNFDHWLSSNQLSSTIDRPTPHPLDANSVYISTWKSYNNSAKWVTLIKLWKFLFLSQKLNIKL